MCECLASACFGLARRAFRAHAQALPAWQYAPQRLLLGQPCTSPSTHPHALPCSQPPRPNSPRSAVSWLVSLRCSYAFGLIRWELLTWERPWAATNPWQISSAVLGGRRLEVPDPAALPGPAADSPEDFAAYVQLMQHCWAQAPGDRPSFPEVVQALRWVVGLLLREPPWRVGPAQGMHSTPLVQSGCPHQAPAGLLHAGQCWARRRLWGLQTVCSSGSAGLGGRREGCLRQQGRSFLPPPGCCGISIACYESQLSLFLCCIPTSWLSSQQL